MSFHNELMFYLTIIPTFVLIFIVRVIVYFNQTNSNKNNKGGAEFEHYYLILKKRAGLEDR